MDTYEPGSSFVREPTPRERVLACAPIQVLEDLAAFSDPRQVLIDGQDGWNDLVGPEVMDGPSRLAHTADTADEASVAANLRRWAFHEAGHRWAHQFAGSMRADSVRMHLRLVPCGPFMTGRGRRRGAAFDLAPREQLTVAAAGLLAQAALDSADKAAARWLPFDVLDIEDPAIWDRRLQGNQVVCSRTMCQGEPHAAVLAALADDGWYREQLTTVLAHWRDLSHIAQALIEDRRSVQEVIGVMAVPGNADDF